MRGHLEAFRVHQEEFRVHAEERRVHAEEFRVHAKEFRVHAKEFRVHAKERQMDAELHPVLRFRSRKDAVVRLSRATRDFLGPGPNTLRTFTIDGQFTLLPGEAWRLRSNMMIETSAGSLGAIGTGSGFFDIRITPEPGTPMLLAFSTPLVLARKCRHC